MFNLLLGFVLVVGGFLVFKAAVPVNGKPRSWVKEPITTFVTLAVVGGWAVGAILMILGAVEVVRR